MKTLYDFKAKTIKGEMKDLSEFKDNVILVINTATQCGLAYQFHELQRLYDTYQDQGFTVLAFPSNQFNQEPEPREEIEKHCTLQYEITFPLFDKIYVKGDNIHPLFDWLTTVKRGILTKGIKWNFTKFLIDRNGNVVKRFSPYSKPQKIKPHIEKLL